MHEDDLKTLLGLPAAQAETKVRTFGLEPQIMPAYGMRSLATVPSRIVELFCDDGAVVGVGTQALYDAGQPPLWTTTDDHD